MHLQNSVVYRFVRRFLNRFKNWIKQKKVQRHNPVDLFSFEYVYYTGSNSTYKLTARVIRNGEPYCMYYYPDTFNPLENRQISKMEQRMMLEDLNSGQKIDGLTFLHTDPNINANPTLLEDLLNSIRELKSS